MSMNLRKSHFGDRDFKTEKTKSKKFGWRNRISPIKFTKHDEKDHLANTRAPASRAAARHRACDRRSARDSTSPSTTRHPLCA
jgi:hypothetical protein